MEKGSGMNFDIQFELTKVGKKLDQARKRLLALEKKGVDIKAPKRIRKFLDKGKDKA